MNPASHTISASEDPAALDHGLIEWVGTIDHKKIGILYLVTTLGFFLVGGVEALLIRIQLARPENTFLSPDLYNQIFTMHGTTMIFLVVMPALIGFANYFIPLMIGARDMAFPRLNAMSYWMLLFGGLMLHFSFIAGGAPAAGWFSYAPLSETPFMSTKGTDYWVLSLLVLGVGSVSSAINIIVTVLTLRAPGLTIRRLPLFVWMVFVNSILIILALPVLNASIVMLLIDRQLDAHFFMPSHGGSAVVWQHFFWTFGHPEVYIMALPAFGMISEVIPVFSRKPIFGYEFVAASTVAISILSFAVWAHHMFAVGLGYQANLFFAAGSMLIAIPTGVKIFNWTATMWGGSIRFTTAMLFAMAFLVEFVIGGLSGVMFAVTPIDWSLTDRYFVVAHFHYVLFGGTLFAMMAATYYWFPKMSGRMLSEKWGRIQFLLLLIGFNMTFFVQHFLGMMGMPRRVYTYPDMPGWFALNLVSTAGAFIMGAGMLVLVWNIVLSLLRGQRAGDNPWNAWTLEWATTSPPPEHNFELVPPVEGRRPLWDLANPDKTDRMMGQKVEGGDPSFEKNRTGMASFLVSEAVFFIMLIVAYVIYSKLPGGDPSTPTAKNSLEPIKAGIFTICLLASSFTIWIAERGLTRKNYGTFRLWLFITIVLGGVFMIGQGNEYLELFHRGINASTNLFATSFFTLTGFHGLHVTVGLIALTILLGLALWRDGVKLIEPAVGTIGMYWHFVDVVWIVVFSVIYLRIWL